MNKNLKNKIMVALQVVFENEKENNNLKENFCDLFNLTKLVDNYEYFEKDIAILLDKKAKEDKWNDRGD